MISWAEPASQRLGQMPPGTAPRRLLALPLPPDLPLRWLPVAYVYLSSSLSGGTKPPAGPGVAPSSAREFAPRPGGGTGGSRAAAMRRDTGQCAASGVGGENLAQGGGEGVRVAGHAVFAAEESAVVAGE